MQSFCIGGQTVEIEGWERPFPKGIFSAEIIENGPGKIILRTDGPLTTGQKLLYLGASLFCEGKKRHIGTGLLTPLERGRPIVGVDIILGANQCQWVWVNPPELILEHGNNCIVVFRIT